MSLPPPPLTQCNIFPQAPPSTKTHPSLPRAPTTLASTPLQRPVSARPPPPATLRAASSADAFMRPLTAIPQSKGALQVFPNHAASSTPPSQLSHPPQLCPTAPPPLKYSQHAHPHRQNPPPHPPTPPPSSFIQLSSSHSPAATQRRVPAARRQQSRPLWAQHQAIRTLNPF
jgi:hypothetical protein